MPSTPSAVTYSQYITPQVYYCFYNITKYVCFLPKMYVLICVDSFLNSVLLLKIALGSNSKEQDNVLVLHVSSFGAQIKTENRNSSHPLCHLFL